MVSAQTETREGTTQEDRVTCVVRHENGILASHYHGFDQISHLDRTAHRLVCELGDVWVEGWIPTSLTVNGAMDADGLSHLQTCCPGADCTVEEEYSGDRQDTLGRGKPRHVTQRIRLDYCPTPDKQTVYSNSVRDLLADQIAFIRDGNHGRRVTESNGRDSLAFAEAAVRLADVT